MPHVEHVDYLSREIDPITGHLHTQRLITCRQPIPSFLASMLTSHHRKESTDHTYFLERSVVDPVGRCLQSQSTNLSMRDYVTVKESCIYRIHHPHEQSQTLEPPTNAVSNVAENAERSGTTRPMHDHLLENVTLFSQHASVQSHSRWSPIREIVEDFCLSRFQSNSVHGRVALQDAITCLCERVVCEENSDE